VVRLPSTCSFLVVSFHGAEVHSVPLAVPILCETVQPDYLLHKEIGKLPCVQIFLAWNDIAHFGQLIVDHRYGVISV